VVAPAAAAPSLCSPPRPGSCLTISHSVFSSSSSRCSHLRSLSIQASRSTCTMVGERKRRCGPPLFQFGRVSPLKRGCSSSSCARLGACVCVCADGRRHVCVCAPGQRQTEPASFFLSGCVRKWTGREPFLFTLPTLAGVSHQKPTPALPCHPSPIHNADTQARHAYTSHALPPRAGRSGRRPPLPPVFFFFRPHGQPGRRRPVLPASPLRRPPRTINPPRGRGG